MWKTVLAGTAAAVISSSSLVFADQMCDSDGASRWQPSAADIKAFTDARVAALKAGLELTAEQEKNWPAVEAAIRDMAKARADRMVARTNEQARPSDPVEALHQRAERLGTVATGLKKLADAEEPLYKSLDDAQKQRFEILTQSRFHRHMGSAGWQKPSEHGDD